MVRGMLGEPVVSCDECGWPVLTAIAPPVCPRCEYAKQEADFVLRLLIHRQPCLRRRGMRDRLVPTPVSFLFGVIIRLLDTPFPSAPAPLEKLRVAYTVIAPTQASVWTAKEMGYYAKHGLHVELVLLVGAPLAVAALVGGETPIVHTGASAVITSNLAGSGAVIIAGA